VHARGETAFVSRLIEESAALGGRVDWFTTLVSRAENLPAVSKALKRAKAARTRVVEMAQGQKKSRLVAWTFR
jgi:23S rRNA (adenine1618-N6)-methyltransferase